MFNKVCISCESEMELVNEESFMGYECWKCECGKILRTFDFENGIEWSDSDDR